MKKQLQTTYVLLQIVHEKPIPDLATVCDQRLSTLNAVVKIDGKIVDAQEKWTDRLRQLHEICGYVENGTSQTMKLFQDDATKDWLIKIGEGSKSPRVYVANYIGAVLDLATAGESDTPTNG